MTFRPVTFGSGLSAWSLLKATLPHQTTAFNSSVRTKSDTEYFREQFNNIVSPEDIVGDRRILRVTLGAYGLSDDIDNRHFIKTIMEEGFADRGALANKLSDRRYRTLAGDFDFSKLPPAHKQKAGLAEKVISNYQAQSFEIEIGKSNPDMRLALGFARNLHDVADASASNSAAWFQVLATPPLREVFQTALGLPKAFAQLDIDAQHSRIMEKASRTFGTDQLTDLAKADATETITRRFLISRQTATMSGSSSSQTALILLQAMPPIVRNRI